jgi:hypothetical protein
MMHKLFTFFFLILFVLLTGISPHSSLEASEGGGRLSCFVQQLKETIYRASFFREGFDEEKLKKAAREWRVLSDHNKKAVLRDFHLKGPEERFLLVTHFWQEGPFLTKYFAPFASEDYWKSLSKRDQKRWIAFLKAPPREGEAFTEALDLLFLLPQGRMEKFGKLLLPPLPGKEKDLFLHRQFVKAKTFQEVAEKLGPDLPQVWVQKTSAMMKKKAAFAFHLLFALPNLVLTKKLKLSPSEQKHLAEIIELALKGADLQTLEGHIAQSHLRHLAKKDYLRKVMARAVLATGVFSAVHHYGTRLLYPGQENSVNLERIDALDEYIISSFLEDQREVALEKGLPFDSDLEREKLQKMLQGFEREHKLKLSLEIKKSQEQSTY